MLDREIQPRPSAATPLATAVIFALLCSVLGLLGHGCCPLHLIQPRLLEGQEETRRFAGTETSKWVSKLLAFACSLEKCEPTCSQRFQNWSTTAKLLAFLDESSIILCLSPHLHARTTFLLCPDDNFHSARLGDTYVAGDTTVGITFLTWMF